VNQVYNVACGHRTTLNELYSYIRDLVGKASLADISKARDLLGYDPGYAVQKGLEMASAWYVESLGQKSSQDS